MLRVHFTGEDLARVVLLDDVLPQMNEAVLALQVLRRSDQGLRFGPWRAQTARRLPRSVRPLADLVPAYGWIPDFLTPPVVGSANNEAALDAIRATPARRLTADLTRLAIDRTLPSWAGTLAHGDTGAMTAVTGALAAFHQVAIAPHAQRIQAATDADLVRRSSTLARQGVEALLRQLHPAVSWQPPVLTLPSASAEEADVHLDGRGLCLAPMVFCGPLPRLWFGGADIMPALTYQVPFDPLTASPLAEGAPRQHPRALALGRLLGSTRSVILHVIASVPGLTTAQLAHRADIAMATASEHATVLREAGLVTSHRDGNRVRHYATSTATALLNSSGT